MPARGSAAVRVDVTSFGIDYVRMAAPANIVDLGQSPPPTVGSSPACTPTPCSWPQGRTNRPQHRRRDRLERALRIEEAIYGPDHLEVASTLTNLGIVLQDLGDLAGAWDRDRALQIKEAAYGPDHPEVASTLGNLGIVLQDLGDWPAPGTA